MECRGANSALTVKDRASIDVNGAKDDPRREWSKKQNVKK